MGVKIECAKRTKVVCDSKQFGQGPSNCSTVFGRFTRF